jgi:hypothetical protein
MPGPILRPWLSLTRLSLVPKAAREGVGGSRSKIPACSTTRVKSAIVLSLMVDGSGSRSCRIFGRLRPVRIVRKRGAVPHQSASRSSRQIARSAERAGRPLRALSSPEVSRGEDRETVFPSLQK